MERMWRQAQHESEQQPMDSQDERTHQHQDRGPAAGSALSRSPFTTGSMYQDKDDGEEQRARAHCDEREMSWLALRDGEERYREARSYGYNEQPNEPIRRESDLSMRSFVANQSQLISSSQYDEQSQRRPTALRPRELVVDVGALDIAGSSYGAAPVRGRVNFYVHQDDHPATQQDAGHWTYPRASFRSDGSSRRGSPRVDVSECPDQATSSSLEEKSAARQTSYPSTKYPAMHPGSDRYAMFINQSTRFQPERTRSQVPDSAHEFGTTERSAEDTDATAATVPGSGEGKHHSRECKVEGCPNYIINRGVCFRHGGGRKCSQDGCTSSAKSAGKCWKHGGSVKCLVETCTRKGKSRGVCWAHGGGTMCTSPDCEKVAVSGGFCWAHGGGKRCAFEGCNKPASKRTHDYCASHYALLKDGNVTLEV